MSAANSFREEYLAGLGQKNNAQSSFLSIALSFAYERMEDRGFYINFLINFVRYLLHIPHKKDSVIHKTAIDTESQDAKVIASLRMILSPLCEGREQ